MLITAEIIAKKYGIALFKTHCTSITEEKIQQLLRMREFLTTHKYFLSCLLVPSAHEDVQLDLLEKIAACFDLEKLLNRLFHVLIKHNRVILLSNIIKHVIFCYQQMHKISVFTVKSSHILHDEEKKHIINFIQLMVPTTHTIQTNFTLAPELIYGISIKSDTLQWERSLKKVLQQVEQSMFQQVGL